MAEYIFHNIQYQPILFLLLHSRVQLLIGTESKEAAMRLPKLYIVWSVLLPMGINGNDTVVCLKEKNTREIIHLKRYALRGRKGIKTQT